MQTVCAWIWAVVGKSPSPLGASPVSAATLLRTAVVIMNSQSTGVRAATVSGSGADIDGSPRSSNSQSWSRTCHASPALTRAWSSLR